MASLCLKKTILTALRGMDWVISRVKAGLPVKMVE